jgi:hypothetical protein
LRCETPRRAKRAERCEAHTALQTEGIPRGREQTRQPPSTVLRCPSPRLWVVLSTFEGWLRRCTRLLALPGCGASWRMRCLVFSQRLLNIRTLVVHHPMAVGPLQGA